MTVFLVRAAYGDRGSPPKIGGGDTLIFQMELLEIKGNKVPASKCNPTNKAKCSEKEVAYIEKQVQKGLDVGKMEAEVTRLKGMLAQKVSHTPASRGEAVNLLLSL